MARKMSDFRLPATPAAGGSYTVVKEFGEHLLYVSGCGPNLGDEVWKGRLQETYTTAQGAQAAENCARNMLAAIQAQIGSLGRIRSVVKLLVFVAGPSEYGEQSLVANGATDFLIELLGDPCGRPARSAIGVNSLPNQIPVEIEGLFEIEPASSV